jgi:predicted RNA-binding protein YlxR (DUF448 family)
MSVAIKVRDELPTRGKARDSERRCAVTGESREKSALIRFVVGPDGSIVTDIVGSLPGRGIWVGAERSLIERACEKRGVLSRAGRVAPDLADQVERFLIDRCQSIVGLTRRAGELAAGQDAVRALLRAGDAGAMIVARDASEDGRDKVERLRAAVAPNCPVVDVLDRSELGFAIGRASAVHLAVRAGRLAAKLLAESDRLAGFRAVAAKSAPSSQIGGREVFREAERR